MEPRSLASFAGAHRDETIIVCGCGRSLSGLAHPQRFVTIGVNDVGRLFDPTYLVVVNPPSQFAPDRFQYVRESKARYLFSQLDLGVRGPTPVRFQLGRYGGTTFTDPNVLHYTRNSPYVALCLAAYMGARRIGLVGVDFTDDHFFGATGPHTLAAQLTAIDAEYRQLGDALAARGIEVVNLSPVSRLTAFPRQTLVDDPPPRAAAPPPAVPRRIFAVTYRFLACGHVISDGLRHAAASRGVEWAEASWDDASLPSRVARFDPDLLLVVHGRRFVQRWGSTFEGRRSAVWLLDEPYEVDDTASFSGRFTHVFVNDAATLARHRNAAYLPVCHDPAVHFPSDATPRYDVGFVGGANPTRERMLARLASRGLLSYVVGGPWQDAALNRLTRSRNIPPAETADLYRATKIVVNVFRDRHHFNGQLIAGTSLNPRVYEALACGALVVSERRPSIAEVVPDLPTFETDDELVAIVERYLSDDELWRRTREACRASIRQSTYAARLDAILDATRDVRLQADSSGVRVQAESGVRLQADLMCSNDGPPSRASSIETAAGDGSDGSAIPAGWRICGPVDYREADGDIVLRSLSGAAPGSERGVVTVGPHRDVTLSFEVCLPADACFIAKIHQTAQTDQCANSYHLYCDGGAYVARHLCVFKTIDVPRGEWVSLRLSHARGELSVAVADREVVRVRDGVLHEGFAFLGIKRGEVRLRHIQLTAAAIEPAAVPRPPLDGELLEPGNPARRPRVSIVTTVYDRVACLADCLRSVRGLRFTDYEQVVVSDCPPPAIVNEIAALVRSFADDRLSYVNLRERHNDWGIAPAAVGLRRARGEYVCFLSDDNGYTPEHVGTLVAELDRQPRLGFVYSSCRYAGRLVLRHPVPAPARIDLGQPMFRRELFRAHLDDDLPFHIMGWDWALVDTLMKHGVAWKHIDVPSFIFRLACYPQLKVPA
jgi:hypothetical protein